MNENRLINIDLNQTISRFELVEIQKESNRWIIFYTLMGLFIFVLGFNLFILNRYNDLISSRINKADILLNDAKKIREKYESYDMDVSISQSDIDKLYQIESDRLSLANKLQDLAFLIPDEMSLLDFEYNYGRKEMVVILTSNTENDQYEKNIDLLSNNLERSTQYSNSYNFNKDNSGIFGDSDFNFYDIRREKDNHKQQDFYKVILTLRTK
ncbi:MAG: hypothetical protein CMG21_03500 [Candidatus Marinimicrobia bacterium]|nr:hypothetical protein [Candidatus Neomarinimicrobiota bacterium]